MSLVNYIEECIKELNEECENVKWKLHKNLSFRNENKCRNYFVHQLKPCVEIYQDIHNSCEKKVKYNEINSIVGRIVATSGFTVDKVLDQIKEFLKEKSCKEQEGFPILV